MITQHLLMAKFLLLRILQTFCQHVRKSEIV